MELVTSNYRPVSNLPYISKLVEKAMLEQINHHCNIHNLLLDNQAGYRENRSCKTVLLKLTNGLLWSMERKDITVMITLNLSVAFDTVNHKLLLSNLQNNFGISGTALEWLRNYLNHRDMRVKIGKSYSERKELTFSVPQGSCSGVNLFNMYSGTIREEVDPHLNLLAYADDHVIKKLLDPNQAKEERNVINLLTENITNINEWMNSVRLKMNNSKLEFVIFGNRTQVNKYTSEGLKTEGEIVNRSPIVKYLGAWLDSKLSLKHT